MYCFVNSDICTNLLGTRVVRATGNLCEVPMYFLVIFRMQLSYMVKLCSKDKSLTDFGTY